MTPAEIIRAAWPGASDGLVDHVLWGRTPYPCGAITAKSLYHAASQLKRATDHGKQLCEFCHRVVTKPDEWLCDHCEAALSEDPIPASQRGT